MPVSPPPPPHWPYLVYSDNENMRNINFSRSRVPVLTLLSLRKTVGKVSLILVMLTSRSDFDVESSNVSLKENKPDGINPSSNDIDYYV